jgi:hypothetical protein
VEVPVNKLSLALLFVPAIGLATVGCGTESAICNDACDCEGCSDSQFDNCLDNFDDTERRADNEGCLDLYDDYVVCLDDTGRCDGNDWETSCGYERDRLKKCLDDRGDDFNLGSGKKGKSPL